VKQAISRTLSTVGIFLCAQFSPLIASGALLTTTEYRITTSSTYDTTPSVGHDNSGYYVIYTSRELTSSGFGPGGVIWMQRLEDDGKPAGSPVQISTGVPDDQLNDCDGSYIVYTKYESAVSMSGSFILYNIATGTSTVLASATAVREARIKGNYVVWAQGATTAATLQLLDLTSLASGGLPSSIAGPSPSAFDPDIGDRYVVYDVSQNGQRDLFAYELATGNTTSVANDPVLNEWMPATFGSWVTWEERTPGVTNTRIMALNMETGERRVIVDNGAASYTPTISGDYLSYESRVNGNFDIFVHKLSTGETFQITSSQADERLNNIDGNLVSYVDSRYGSLDVFVSSFNLSNFPPIANAGLPQTVHAGTSITLDGSGSSDPEGDAITYSWTLTTIPQGSTATLEWATTVYPRFSSDVPGTYIATLIVTDSQGNASAPATVTISTLNSPPVADAGSDQAIIAIGTTVTLNGSNTFDPDGDDISLFWTIVSKPAGSMAELDSLITPQTSFIADVQGTYEIRLYAGDIWAHTSDTVIVSFTNVAPVANAGTNQAVAAGITVVLDGSASSDANGDSLTYRWSMLNAPINSQAALNTADSIHPTFVADLPGSYVISLVVNDGFANSAASTMTVTATESTATVIGVAEDAIAGIGQLPPTSFRNPNLQNTLTNKLAAVIQMCERGEYAEALSKLKQDLLPKTDGCAATGVPERNDWITNCAAQT